MAAQKEDHANEDKQKDNDTESESSSIYQAGSVVSTVPDRHGFYGGAQYSPEK